MRHALHLVPPTGNRQRLAEAVDKLARAMAAGEIATDEIQLRALVDICEANQLPIEAARVRRWIAGDVW